MASSQVVSASHLLDGQIGLHDELKNVTVLFADVTNSTGLVEGLSPEAANRLLRPKLEMMTEAVHSHGGVVSSLQGDGLMALFGAPMALEDHALRACRTALDIQKSLTDKLQIHIGLNTGLVLVRSVDTDHSMEYDPVGWTVHLAARMGEMAEPGEIRLTGTTAQQIEGFSTLERLGATRIRGVQRRITTFLLIGMVSERTRWDARRDLGLNRFVGRSVELGVLEQALVDARAGQGQMIALKGEAGIGKSRLLYELEHSSKLDGVRVVYAATQSEGTALAYMAIRQLLFAWLEKGNDTIEQLAATLDTALTAMVPDADAVQRISPALRSLLDIPVTDAAWQRLDAFERQQAIRSALQIWLVSLAQKSPVIIIFEDLHWIDPESEALVHLLAETVRDLSVLLLISHRGEYRWAGPKPDQVITVLGLPDSSAMTLLDGMLGDDPSLAQLKQILVRRAGGTPLFLEELVRSLMETGRLVGNPGSYRSMGDTPESDVPGTITAIVSARIDFQTPTAKAMLELAAVAGGGPRSLLTRASDQDESISLAAIQQLLDAGLLQQPRPGSDLNFRHEVVREITYSLVLEDRRRDLHARVGKAIEAHYSDSLEEHVDQLALHSLAGEDWDSAARYHFRASIRALARSANRQVVSFSQAGIEAIGHLPLTEELRNLTVDLRLIANNALITIGNLNAIVENLVAAELLVEALDDPRRTASVKTHLAVACWLQGDQGRAQESASEAISIACDIDHPALQMGASTVLGMAYHAVGRYDESIALLQHLSGKFTGKARLVRAGWTVYPLVLIGTFLASAHIERGEFDLARKRIDEARSFADEMEHPYSQATILDFEGYLLMSTDQPEVAVPVFEKALELCQRFELLNLHRSISAKLAMAEIRLGQTEAAVGRLEDSIDLRDHLRGGAYVWHWMYLAYGQALLAASRPKAALEQVEISLELTRKNGERPHLGQGLKLKGDILAALGPERMAEAEACYRAAMTEARACGMRPLLAQSGRALGEALAHSGQVEAAERELRTASNTFDALGLPNGRDRAQASLRELMRRA